LKKKRRIWRRLRAPRLDSFRENIEDAEAVLWVVSEWQGEPWSSGAMARTVVAVGFSPVLLLTEKRMEGGRWRRRMGREARVRGEPRMRNKRGGEGAG
jgi:hypothetical protein